MSRLFVGFDAGATATKMITQIDSEEESSVILGGLNLRRVGPDDATSTLLTGIRSAIRDDVQEIKIVGGIAGGLYRASVKRIVKLLHDRLSVLSSANVHARIVSDAELALESAFGRGSGILVMCGTGTVLIARTPENDIVINGGWGYLIGDEGSGHALGARLIRHVTNAMDSGHDDDLVTRFKRSFGIESRIDLLDIVYGGKKLSAFAPFLLDQANSGVEPSMHITKTELDLLVNQIQRFSDAHSQLTIKFGGGLTKNKTYVEILDELLPTIGVRNNLLSRDPSRYALTAARGATS